MKWITLLAASIVTPAFAGGIIPVPAGTTSYLTPCIPLYQFADPKQKATGISGSTSGFIISTSGDDDSSETEYEGAADIESFTQGTYTAPTATSDIGMVECNTGNNDAGGTYQFALRNEVLADDGTTWVTLDFTGGGSNVIDDTWYLFLGALDAAAIEAEAEDALGAHIVEDEGSTYTLDCAIAVIMAILGGPATFGATTYTFQDFGGNETRLSVDVSSSARTNISETCP